MNHSTACWDVGCQHLFSTRPLHQLVRIIVSHLLRFPIQHPLSLGPGIEDDVIRVVGKKSNHISLLEMLIANWHNSPRRMLRKGSVNSHGTHFFQMYLITFKSASVSCSVMSDSLRPTDGSPPGSSVQGILQVRILEWVAISFPGDLSDLGIEPRSPTLQANSSLSEPSGKPLKVQNNH